MKANLSPLIQNNKAIFLDRDGVLIEDCHLLSRKSQIKLIEGIEDFLSILRIHQFKIFIVTNQTVISRGLLDFDQAWELNNYILMLIKSKKSSAFVDDVFICPHHPQANIVKYKIDCLCRKPKPGMLAAAAQKHQINLHKSFLIGDRTSDIIAGNLAGCKTILFASGKQDEFLIETTLSFEATQTQEDHRIDKLEDAIKVILSYGHGEKV